MGIKNLANISFKPTVDAQKCNGCEDCIEVCTARVLAMKQGRAMVLNAEDCQGCGSCIEICREGAVRVENMGVRLSNTCTALLKDIL